MNASLNDSNIERWDADMVAWRTITLSYVESFISTSTGVRDVRELYAVEPKLVPFSISVTQQASGTLTLRRKTFALKGTENEMTVGRDEFVLVAGGYDSIQGGSSSSSAGRPFNQASDEVLPPFFPNPQILSLNIDALVPVNGVEIIVDTKSGETTKETRTYQFEQSVLLFLSGDFVVFQTFFGSQNITVDSITLAGLHGEITGGFEDSETTTATDRNSSFGRSRRKFTQKLTLTTG